MLNNYEDTSSGFPNSHVQTPASIPRSVETQKQQNIGPTWNYNSQLEGLYSCYQNEHQSVYNIHSMGHFEGNSKHNNNPYPQYSTGSLHQPVPTAIGKCHEACCQHLPERYPINPAPLRYPPNGTVQPPRYGEISNNDPRQYFTERRSVQSSIPRKKEFQPENGYSNASHDRHFQFVGRGQIHVPERQPMPMIRSQYPMYPINSYWSPRNWSGPRMSYPPPPPYHQSVTNQTNQLQSNVKMAEPPHYIDPSLSKSLNSQRRTLMRNANANPEIVRPIPETKRPSGNGSHLQSCYDFPYHSGFVPFNEVNKMASNIPAQGNNSSCKVPMEKQFQQHQFKMSNNDRSIPGCNNPLGEITYAYPPDPYIRNPSNGLQQMTDSRKLSLQYEQQPGKKRPDLDVRQFLATWDDDEEESTRMSEPLHNNNNLAPYIVVDCRSLEGEAAAKLQERLKVTSQNFQSKPQNNSPSSLNNLESKGNGSEDLGLRDNEPQRSLIHSEFAENNYSTSIHMDTEKNLSFWNPENRESCPESENIMGKGAFQPLDCTKRDNMNVVEPISKRDIHGDINHKLLNNDPTSHMSFDALVTYYGDSRRVSDGSYDLVEMTERLVNASDKICTIERNTMEQDMTVDSLHPCDPRNLQSQIGGNQTSYHHRIPTRYTTNNYQHYKSGINNDPFFNFKYPVGSSKFFGFDSSNLEPNFDYHKSSEFVRQKPFISKDKVIENYENTSLNKTLDKMNFQEMDRRGGVMGSEMLKKQHTLNNYQISEKPNVDFGSVDPEQFITPIIIKKSDYYKENYGELKSSKINDDLIGKGSEKSVLVHSNGVETDVLKIASNDKHIFHESNVVTLHSGGQSESNTVTVEVPYDEQYSNLVKLSEEITESNRTDSSKIEDNQETKFIDSKADSKENNEPCTLKKSTSFKLKRLPNSKEWVKVGGDTNVDVNDTESKRNTEMEKTSGPDNHMPTVNLNMPSLDDIRFNDEPENKAEKSNSSLKSIDKSNEDVSSFTKLNIENKNPYKSDNLQLTQLAIVPPMKFSSKTESEIKAALSKDVTNENKDNFDEKNFLTSDSQLSKHSDIVTHSKELEMDSHFDTIHSPYNTIALDERANSAFDDMSNKLMKTTPPQSNAESSTEIDKFIAESTNLEHNYSELTKMQSTVSQLQGTNNYTTSNDCLNINNAEILCSGSSERESTKDSFPSFHNYPECEINTHMSTYFKLNNRICNTDKDIECIPTSPGVEEMFEDINHANNDGNTFLEKSEEIQFVPAKNSPVTKSPCCRSETFNSDNFDLHDSVEPQCASRVQMVTTNSCNINFEQEKNDGIFTKSVETSVSKSDNSLSVKPLPAIPPINLKLNERKKMWCIAKKPKNLDIKSTNQNIFEIEDGSICHNQEEGNIDLHSPNSDCGSKDENIPQINDSCNPSPMHRSVIGTNDLDCFGETIHEENEAINFNGMIPENEPKTNISLDKNLNKELNTIENKNDHEQISDFSGSEGLKIHDISVDDSFLHSTLSGENNSDFLSFTENIPKDVLKEQTCKGNEIKAFEDNLEHEEIQFLGNNKSDSSSISQVDAEVLNLSENCAEVILLSPQEKSMKSDALKEVDYFKDFSKNSDSDIETEPKGNDKSGSELCSKINIIANVDMARSDTAQVIIKAEESNNLQPVSNGPANIDPTVNENTCVNVKDMNHISECDIIQSSTEYYKSESVEMNAEKMAEELSDNCAVTTQNDFNIRSDSNIIIFDESDAGKGKDVFINSNNKKDKTECFNNETHMCLNLLETHEKTSETGDWPTNSSEFDVNKVHDENNKVATDYSLHTNSVDTCSDKFVDTCSDKFVDTVQEQEPCVQIIPEVRLEENIGISTLTKCNTEDNGINLKFDFNKKLENAFPVEHYENITVPVSLSKSKHANDIIPKDGSSKPFEVLANNENQKEIIFVSKKELTENIESTPEEECVHCLDPNDFDIQKINTGLDLPLEPTSEDTSVNKKIEKTITLVQCTNNTQFNVVKKLDERLLKSSLHGKIKKEKRKKKRVTISKKAVLIPKVNDDFNTHKIIETVNEYDNKEMHVLDISRNFSNKNDSSFVKECDTNYSVQSDTQNKYSKNNGSLYLSEYSVLNCKESTRIFEEDKLTKNCFPAEILQSNQNKDSENCMEDSNKVDSLEIECEKDIDDKVVHCDNPTKVNCLDSISMNIKSIDYKTTFESQKDEEEQLTTFEEQPGFTETLNVLDEDLPLTEDYREQKETVVSKEFKENKELKESNDLKVVCSIQREHTETVETSDKNNGAVVVEESTIETLSLQLIINNEQKEKIKEFREPLDISIVNKIEGTTEDQNDSLNSLKTDYSLAYNDNDRKCYEGTEIECESEELNVGVNYDFSEPNPLRNNINSESFSEHEFTIKNRKLNSNLDISLDQSNKNTNQQNCSELIKDNFENSSESISKDTEILDELNDNKEQIPVEDKSFENKDVDEIKLKSEVSSYQSKEVEKESDKSCNNATNIEDREMHYICQSVVSNLEPENAINIKTDYLEDNGMIRNSNIKHLTDAENFKNISEVNETQNKNLDNENILPEKVVEIFSSSNSFEKIKILSDCNSEHKIGDERHESPGLNIDSKSNSQSNVLDNFVSNQDIEKEKIRNFDIVPDKFVDKTVNAKNQFNSLPRNEFNIKELNELNENKIDMDLSKSLNSKLSVSKKNGISTGDKSNIIGDISKFVSDNFEEKNENFIVMSLGSNENCQTDYQELNKDSVSSEVKNVGKYTKSQLNVDMKSKRNTLPKTKHLENKPYSKKTAKKIIGKCSKKRMKVQKKSNTDIKPNANNENVDEFVIHTDTSIFKRENDTKVEKTDESVVFLSSENNKYVTENKCSGTEEPVENLPKTHDSFQQKSNEPCVTDLKLHKRENDTNVEKTDESVVFLSSENNKYVTESKCSGTEELVENLPKTHDSFHQKSNAPCVTDLKLEINYDIFDTCDSESREDKYLKQFSNKQSQYHNLVCCDNIEKELLTDNLFPEKSSEYTIGSDINPETSISDSIDFLPDETVEKQLEAMHSSQFIINTDTYKSQDVIENVTFCYEINKLPTKSADLINKHVNTDEIIKNLNEECENSEIESEPQTLSLNDNPSTPMHTGNLVEQNQNEQTNNPNNSPQCSNDNLPNCDTRLSSTDLGCTKLSQSDANKINALSSTVLSNESISNIIKMSDMDTTPFQCLVEAALAVETAEMANKLAIEKSSEFCDKESNSSCKLSEIFNETEYSGKQHNRQDQVGGDNEIQIDKDVYIAENSDSSVPIKKKTKTKYRFPKPKLKGYRKAKKLKENSLQDYIKSDETSNIKLRFWEESVTCDKGGSENSVELKEDKLKITNEYFQNDLIDSLQNKNHLEYKQKYIGKEFECYNNCTKALSATEKATVLNHSTANIGNELNEKYENKESESDVLYVHVDSEEIDEYVKELSLNNIKVSTESQEVDTQCDLDENNVKLPNVEETEANFVIFIDETTETCEGLMDREIETQNLVTNCNTLESSMNKENRDTSGDITIIPNSDFSNSVLDSNNSLLDNKILENLNHGYDDLNANLSNDIANWPYLEEEVTHLDNCLEKDIFETNSNFLSSIKCSLPWERIFNIANSKKRRAKKNKSYSPSNGLELGPAKIELRLASDFGGWKVVSNKQNDSFSPIVNVKRLILQRDPELLSYSEKESEEEIDSKERSESFSQISDGLPHDVKKPEHSYFNSILQIASCKSWQPVVVLNRDKELDSLCLSINTEQNFTKNVSTSSNNSNSISKIKKKILKTRKRSVSQKSIEKKKNENLQIKEEHEFSEELFLHNTDKDDNLSFTDSIDPAQEYVWKCLENEEDWMDHSPLQNYCDQKSGKDSFEEEEITSENEIRHSFNENYSFINDSLSKRMPEIGDVAEAEYENSRTKDWKHLQDSESNCPQREITVGEKKNDLLQSLSLIFSKNRSRGVKRPSEGHSKEDTKRRRRHRIEKYPFHCQKCLIGFKTKEEMVRHKDSRHPPHRELHHCLLCQRSFSSSLRHNLHVEGRSHRHLELVQRHTMHTVHKLLTGVDFPRIRPLSHSERLALDWRPNHPGCIHYYHQLTPLQVALQDYSAREESSSRNGRD